MRQLTGIDTSFLAMEGPNTIGHITGVTIVDTSTSPEPWTFERFRRHLLSRIERIPIFREKLVEIPFGLDRPYWVPDPHFDIDYHLREIGLPGEGTKEQFAEQVARIHARPLDRRRPLWEMYVVDRAHGDLRALVTKIHHAAIDGMSGQEILATLVDLEPVITTAADDEDQADGAEPHAAPPPGPMPDPLAMATTAAVNLITSPVRMTRAALQLARSMPVLGEALGRSGPTARGDESTRELVARFGAAPSTPFNKAIGPHRRWSFSSVPLAEVKEVKNAAGTTVNDVILALVAGVVRTWLADNGGIPDRPLSAMVPLSVRSEDQRNAVGNFVSSTVATLATHIDDPASRLQAIHEGMKSAKSQHQALPATLLTDITQMTAPAVTALAARLIASTKLANRVTPPFNLVVSNVPGPPVPLYVAGAKMVAQYPVSAIVDGVGLNVTVQSTNENLDFGFVADRDLVPDLWAMADLVAPTLAELRAAVLS